MTEKRTVFGLAFVSVVFFIFLRFVLPPSGTSGDPEMLLAAEKMVRATEAIQACEQARGRKIDERSDLNRTGLIGLENSPITTSLGQIEAKRTSTNPNTAALVVRTLKDAGVRKGDAVAIGASSSFPGLIVAALAAAEAMGLKPVMILSLGASNWGANDPGFTSLEMFDCIRDAGVFAVRTAALAVGGINDNGSDMTEEGRAFLERKIAETGLPFLREPDLAKNVGERMSLYERDAVPAKIGAFINIGGSWANMGLDSSILKLKPGLTEVADIPPAAKRGVIQSMAVRGVPVIHLLFMKGLADRYGLPWDPVPLPKPGEGDIFRPSGRAPLAFLVAAAVYLLLVGIGLLFIWRNRSLTAN